MSNGLLALFAFTPILLAAVMLIGLRWPASRAMPLVYLFTAAIGLFVWDMSFNRIIASTLQGLVITLGLLWIIFGAILLLNTLKHSGASPPSAPASPPSAPTAASRPSSSPGYSVASSKVPPASAPRRNRCTAAGRGRLSGNGRGAARHAGTEYPGFLRRRRHPIVVGINSGLDTATIGAQLTAQGSSWSIFLQQITSSVAITHAIVGTVMPLVMVLMLTRFFGKEKSWKAGFEVLPFAIFAGLAFTLPYAATGIFLGPEFPSLLGGLVGLAIVTTAARFKFLTPKTTWDFADARNSRPNGWAPSR